MASPPAHHSSHTHNHHHHPHIHHHRHHHLPPLTQQIETAAESETCTETDKPDYEAWDSPSLISRIRTLESALDEARSQCVANQVCPAPPATHGSTAQHSTAQHILLTQPPHSAEPRAPALARPRKPPRPFDSSRYSSRLIALKFAYVGSLYGGFEYHGIATPLPTVEQLLFAALLKARLVPALSHAADPESVAAWPGDEAVQYSKCGRTDRGVSAFGQVVGVRVRSNKPLAPALPPASWDDVRDEMPYPAILNRLLPPTIRVLAWAPNPPASFSARFDCRARHYRYYFTNPMLSPAAPGGGRLDIAAMCRASGFFEGSHDFRNFCKLDASKQIDNFVRHILHSSIVHVSSAPAPAPAPLAETYYFDLRGSAFLWHQVRHMMAVLFLVGQGLEDAELVRHMLDLAVFPTKPAYEMADDRPLVLWDCVFPDAELQWVAAAPPTPAAPADTAWVLWHEKKIDETLAAELLRLVQGSAATATTPAAAPAGPTAHENPQDKHEKSRRKEDGHVLVLGTGEPVLRGKYVKMVDRKRMRPVAEINASYLERKGDWRDRREGKKRKTVPGAEQ